VSEEFFQLQRIGSVGSPSLKESKFEKHSKATSLEISKNAKKFIFHMNFTFLANLKPNLRLSLNLKKSS
jgi:hypothetical protein